MKRLKKIVSILLTAVMVLAMCVPVMAAEGSATPTTTYTITAPETSHQYEIYQIFTGELSTGGDNEEKILSNVKWGKNGTGEKGNAVDKEILDELTEVNSKTDREILEVVLKYAKLEDPVGFITNGGRYDATPGYYLIKDKDNTVTGADAYTTYIVKVVGNVDITPKSAIPELDKQVHDETTDAESTAVDGWGETADHAINESFQFKLIATLPNDKDLDAYDHYYLKFEDVMGQGVTFEKIESVFVNNQELSEGQYSLSDNAKNGLSGSATWTLSILDLKKFTDDLKNAQITVIYNAHLNENAEVTNESKEAAENNQNKARLIYSNNPNATGDGKTEPKDTGETEYDFVFVLTYESDNTKYKNEVKEGNELENAGFRLYRDSACTDEVFLKKFNGAYYPVAANNTTSAEEMKSASDGTFNIKGLDAGTYYLKETTTPSGYNTASIMTIQISATHMENTATTAKVELTKTVNGVLYTINQVVNKSGSTLPETGGIGTTIFYVVGIVLMLGAGVLLITKRRMDAKH